MTDFNSADHPRGHVNNSGSFSTRTFGGYEGATLERTPITAAAAGTIPVRLADRPDAEVSRFDAAALIPGTTRPLFTELEFRKVIALLNSEEAEPAYTWDGKAFSGANGECTSVPSAHGQLWALDEDGTNDFEIRDGVWFASEGVTQLNNPVQTERAEAAAAASFQRSFVLRRSDGKFVTRTTTWFVEEFDDSDSEGLAPGDSPISYSVIDRTEDTVSATESYWDDVQDSVSDLFSEDHLTSDRVFADAASAEAFAKSAAQNADIDVQTHGWDGYVS